MYYFLSSVCMSYLFSYLIPNWRINACVYSLHSAVLYAYAVWCGVCPSVCASVTLVYCVTLVTEVEIAVVKLSFHQLITLRAFFAKKYPQV